VDSRKHQASSGEICRNFKDYFSRGKELAMTGQNAAVPDGGGLNPQALSMQDLVRVLSAVARRKIATETIQADIDAGAPTNADGTINLVNYAAWLVKGDVRGN
jgi:hypothetical protein